MRCGCGIPSTGRGGLPGRVIAVAQSGGTLVPPTDRQSIAARGISVPDLIASIEEYLDVHNEDPRPYIWTAKAESILAKIARGRIALEKVS